MYNNLTSDIYELLPTKPYDEIIQTNKTSEIWIWRITLKLGNSVNYMFFACTKVNNVIM